MPFICDCVSSSESRLSTAHNILSMFRPRSKPEQDKLELLSNLCRIYSNEPKEVKRAVLELTDMQAKNVRHVTASTFTHWTLCYSVFNHWRLLNAFLPFSVFRK